MSERAHLSRSLSAMGSTADDVASTLKARAIQGVRNAVRFLNPVVRYLQTQTTEELRELDVIKPRVLRIAWRNGKKEEIGLPDAVCNFLDAFNAGAYPDLELPPPA